MPNQIERAITPRTKLIILNSPSNPSGRVIPPAEFKRIMELLSRAWDLRHLGRVLLALCLPAGRGFQRRQPTAGTPKPPLHRRLVFKNLRHDWLAHGLCAGSARVDPGDAEGPEPLDKQPQFNCPARRDRGFQWTARVSGCDVG